MNAVDFWNFDADAYFDHLAERVAGPNRRERDAGPGSYRPLPPDDLAGNMFDSPVWTC
jgi:hypothetical protein